MEELINELDIFVNEKAILSAQIKDIENKRNELAKERNTKKAQNKIKNATMNFYDHCCKKPMFPAGIEPTTSA